MPPLYPLTSDQRFLLGDIQSRLDYWRRAVKLGGVVTVSMDQYETVQPAAIRQGTDVVASYGNHIPGRGQTMKQFSPAELDEIADHLDCVWAMNPSRRLYYFIPKELTGEGQR